MILDPDTADWFSRFFNIEPAAHSDEHERIVASLRQSLPTGCGVLVRGYDELPELFDDLDHPPGVLFVRGSLAAIQVADRIGVVGTRRLDGEGVRVTRRLCGELAVPGVAIVSGGALGVDGLAHEAAVRAGVPTLVVLPGGIDAPSPVRHRALFDQVVESGGALVTEYPPGTRPRKFTFRRRNELIAAASSRLVVPRARKSGGTHITVEAALALGRPVFAAPGSPEDPYSEGCLDLLADGRAAMIRTGRDILTNARATDVETMVPTRGLSADAATIAGLLKREGALTPEAIALRTGVPMGIVLGELTMLEIAGVARLASGIARYSFSPSNS